MSNESSVPTPATPDVCTAALLVEGQEISGQFQLLSIVVTRELNRIPSATVQLQDGDAAKASFAASDAQHFIPGKRIEIRLGYRSQNSSVFRGVITRHGVRIRQQGSQLNIECRDPAFKMTHGLHNRFHTDPKDSDIMETLIKAHGLQAEVAATQPELQAVPQYESSDWDFLLCRAEANGMVVRVEDGKLRIAPPAADGPAALSLRYGAAILELDAEIDARWQSKGVKASAWDPGAQERLEADAQEPSLSTAGNLSPADLAQASGDEVQEIRHGGRLKQAELQAWANARLLKERLAKIRGRAKCQGFAGILPGDLIEITGIGKRFAGKLYVSGVRHHLAGGNWETDVQFGLNPELFAAAYNLRPLPAAGLLAGVSGLQTGIVAALEKDPDGEGRIQVRLPLADSAGGADAGVWARLATLAASKGYGAFFRPDIGDEVVVGFLHDDPRQPVILGMCHSSARPAPEPAADDNFRKGYLSRKQLRLNFDDEKKTITLETPAGNKITLSEDAKAVLITDQNGNKITLNADGVSIESSKDLVLKAKGDLKIEAVNADLKAKAAVKLDAKASAEISGASATLKGSATTVIQGGIVQIN